MRPRPCAVLLSVATLLAASILPTAPALAGYGFVNGSSTDTRIWTENGGQDFVAVGQDTHAGSAAYVFSTQAGVLGAGASSVTETALSIPDVAAGVRIDDLTQSFDWLAMGATFAAVSAQSVCDETLFAPSPTHLNGTSSPDTYVACMAGVGTAQATGATAIQALGLAGATGTLAWLSLQNWSSAGVRIPDWVGTAETQTAETQTAETEETAAPTNATTAPPAVGETSTGEAPQADVTVPLPEQPEEWPDYLNIYKLSAKVASINALSVDIADVVTTACAYEVAAAALDEGPDACAKLPIFASGQSDVPEATNHDIAAIASYPEWAKLNYRPRTLNPSPAQWYKNAPINCQGGASNNCDEFPFYSTLQGGRDAVPLPSVALIGSADNQAQGTLLNSFYNGCHVKTSTSGAFLNVPIPASSSTVPTLAICNGN